MKRILLVGSSSFTKSLQKLFKSPSQYKVTETLNPDHAEHLVATGDPDYVLCAGTIQVNKEGKYFLDID